MKAQVTALVWLRRLVMLSITTHSPYSTLCSQLAQDAAPSSIAQAGAKLDEFISFEEKQLPVLTYSQSYVDDENEPVSYAGTLYTAIRAFTVEGCDVLARIVVQDRYSGSIQHRRVLGRTHEEYTGALRDDTVYEYRFSLSKLQPDGTTTLRAKPLQFASGTKVNCNEDSSCTLSWVRLESRNADISERVIVNDAQEFDRRVRSITLPMATPDEAINSAKLFDDAVQACAINGKLR
jgi:hypothetical protein